jgi:hypothetical protein
MFTMTNTAYPNRITEYLSPHLEPKSYKHYVVLRSVESEGNQKIVRLFKKLELQY